MLLRLRCHLTLFGDFLTFARIFFLFFFFFFFFLFCFCKEYICYWEPDIHVSFVQKPEIRIHGELDSMWAIQIDSRT